MVALNQNRGFATESGLVRVRARNFAEAMRAVHRDFGPEAHVVHSKVIRKEGMLGMVGGTEVEVVVRTRKADQDSVDSTARRVDPAPAEPRPATKPERSSDSSDDAEDALERFAVRLERQFQEKSARRGAHLNEILREKQIPLVDAREPRPLPTEETAAPAPAPTLDRASDAVRVSISEECATRSRVDAREGSGSGSRTDARSGKIDFAQVKPSHPIIRAAARRLARLGFSEESRSELLRRLRERALPSGLGDEDAIETTATLELATLLQPMIPPCRSMSLERPAHRARRVAFVGSSGVGKTTTIVKLAIPLKVDHGANVAIATLDAYRIGAAEQLRRYGEIAGIPIHEVGENDDLGESLSKIEADFLFIDTPGFGPRSKDLTELSDRLAPVEFDETHLCVATSLSREFALDMIARYQSFRFDRLILTKVDEPACFGPVLDLLRLAATPVSYLSCGQEVPQDLRVANQTRLTDLLVGGER